MSFETPEKRKEGNKMKAFEVATQLDEIFGDRIEDRLTVDHSIEVLAQAINFMGQNTRERLKMALEKAGRS